MTVLEARQRLLQQVNKYVRVRIADLKWEDWNFNEGTMYNTKLTDRKAGTAIIGINCKTDGTGNPQTKPSDTIGYYGANATYKRYIFIRTGISGNGVEKRTERREWIKEHFADAAIIYEKE